MFNVQPTYKQFVLHNVSEDLIDSKNWIPHRCAWETEERQPVVEKKKENCWVQENPQSADLQSLHSQHS